MYRWDYSVGSHPTWITSFNHLVSSCNPHTYLLGVIEVPLVRSFNFFVHTWPWPRLLASHTALTLAFLRGFENFRYCYQGPSSPQGFHGSFHPLATLKVRVIIICRCCCPSRTGLISTIYFHSGFYDHMSSYRGIWCLLYNLDVCSKLLTFFVQICEKCMT